ncbi:MAG: hypothetical protein HC846_11165 [Blastocatellia bacterium]|nr:hypothetical protein [Blastocatellia bacterium]
MVGGRQINLFTEARGTKTGLYSIDVAANKLTEYDETVGVFTVTMNKVRNMLGMVWQSAKSPPEVYVAKITDLMPTQISKVNADIAKMPIPKSEVIKWKSTDGREIEGILTYPVNYQAGQKVPLILNIHGGPAGVFQMNLSAVAEFIRLQVLRRKVMQFCARIRVARRATERNSGGQISRIGAEWIIRI